MPVKILSLVWYKVLPPKFGGQKGIALFNQHLARHCELTCLCSNDNQDPGDLHYKVRPVLPTGRKHVLNPSYWLQIRKAVSSGSPSFLILEHPYHGIGTVMALLGKKTRLIIHAHNIESHRFRQIKKWWWKILAAYEAWVFRRAELVLFKTSSDSDFAIQRFKLPPEKSLVIPYGIEQPVLASDAKSNIRNQFNIAAEEKILLFAGTLDYDPNAKAVEYIYQELAPRLRDAGFPFRIIICGRNKFSAFQYLNDFNAPDITMAGEQDSITPFFAAADVFINTTVNGGGIQTKILDAVSHQCNTVSFAQMITGIPEEVCGPKLFIAEEGNWDEFAALTIIAAENKYDTPDTFFEHFSWDRLIQPLIRKLRLHE
jgi:glycosyltransferase involved in cell wall biosynthesis